MGSPAVGLALPAEAQKSVVTCPKSHSRFLVLLVSSGLASLYATETRGERETEKERREPKMHERKEKGRGQEAGRRWEPGRS